MSTEGAARGPQRGYWRTIERLDQASILLGQAARDTRNSENTLGHELVQHAHETVKVAHEAATLAAAAMQTRRARA